jgi:hypothetical protein
VFSGESAWTRFKSRERRRSRISSQSTVGKESSPRIGRAWRIASPLILAGSLSVGLLTAAFGAAGRTFSNGHSPSASLVSHSYVCLVACLVAWHDDAFLQRSILILR